MNGQIAATWSDPTPLTGGHLGLATWNGAVHFDDVRARTIGVFGLRMTAHMDGSAEGMRR